jgi:integrase
MPEILRFIRQTACGHSPQHAQHLVAALRALFRFLHLRGELARNLAPALPNVAHWTLAELPRSISAEAVQRVLESCDRQTGVGRRDYAILLLLARLGLRAGEVLRLELEDLDWRNARIAVRARKGSGLAQLPLSEETGRAIAAYLRRDRPRSASRRIFLRVRAPYAPLSDPGVISSVVRRALCRANVPSRCTGAHLLRHSLATTMLQHGASLDEIGQLLRHRSPNSTAIYAKVDVAALRRLASVWPGGVR